MEEMIDLKRRLEEERPMGWDGFPDIALYMDQVISYVSRQLITFGEGDALTPAMVNNYIKADLLPRAEGKKYGKTHLAHLTAICAMKQVLSVKETQTLLSSGMDGREAQRVYAAFCQELDEAEMATASLLPTEISPEELPQLALRLALCSYANRLACQRILSLITPPEPQATKPSKKKK